MTRLARSFLYVPGTEPSKMDKALAGDADAIILDLEDAVPLSRKAEAREIVADWIRGLTEPAAEIWIRVNPGSTGLEEIAALKDLPDLTGFVLAKAEVDSTRAAVDAADGTGLLVSPVLETSTAILDASAIAGSGVDILQIGEYDLCADVGITSSDSGDEVSWARAQVVFASRAAGLRPPPAPVSIEIRDTAALANQTRRAARQGFVGRACIHPAQVPVVHEVFTPTNAEIEEARVLLDRFESLDGTAVMIDDQGRLVDEATLRTARQKVALASTQHDRSKTNR